MKELKTLIVAFLMVSTVLMAFTTSAPAVKGSIITKFSDATSEHLVTLELGGGTSLFNVTLPGNSKVVSASVNVTNYNGGGLDNVYPHDVYLDVGADGDNEWSWQGAGVGGLGLQTQFTDDSNIKHVSFKANGGSDTTTTVRLPAGAQITSATMDIFGDTIPYFNTTQFNGATQDYMGYRIGSAGDLNKDGFPDFFAGAPHDETSGSPGHVYIWFGGSNWHKTADLTLTGEQIDSEFGLHADSAGDVNNDGFDDLIVTACTWTNNSSLNKGAAYIYYGGNPMDATPDVKIYGFGADDYLGDSVAGVGDVNGDGFDDVVIGDYGNSTAGAEYGGAYLFLGGSPMNSVADLYFNPMLNQEYLGCMADGLGDINSDGFADFMIGAYWDDANISNKNWGAVYIYFGGAVPNNVSDIQIQPAGTRDFGRWGRNVGDLNDDGFNDIAIMNNANEVWLYYLGPGKDNVRDLLFTGDQDYSNYGWGISGAGDINGDGYNDLIIGADAWETIDYYNVGRAYLYWGGPAMDTTVDCIFTGSNEYDYVGSDVSGIGDFNADGKPEFLIGAMGISTGGDYAGAVTMYTYSIGLLDPRVTVEPTGATLWNKTGPFQGLVTTADLTAKLKAALALAPVSFTDAHGIEFKDLTLNVSNKKIGGLAFKNLSIQYDIDLKVQNFEQEIKDYMSVHPAVKGMIDVPFEVSSLFQGGLRFHDLKIVTTLAPVGTPTTGLSLDEGTSNATLLDLRGIFTDEVDTPSSLTFAVVDTTNSSHVKASIDQGHYLSVDAKTSNSDINWTGFTTINVTATNKAGLTSLRVPITVSIVNVEDAPVIISTPALSAKEGVRYIYDVNAVDGDAQDTLTYSLVSTVSGMAINPSAGELTWTPSVKDYPGVEVTIKVSDGKMNDTQTFHLTVELRVSSGNHLPVITSIPSTNARVGYTYSYSILARDDDSDKLHFFLEVGPKNMTIDESTGKISWLPVLSESGTANIVRVNLSDGKDRIFQIWTIYVSNETPNNLPIIHGAPQAKAYVGLQYYYKFNVTDKDGDTVTFLLTQGPTGLTVDSTGVLSWTPALAQVGNNSFSIEISDGKGFVRRTFGVGVFVNHAPTITSTPLAKAKVGKTYSYTVTVQDLDTSDVVLISLVDAPTGMSFDNATKTVTWKPTKKMTGTFDVSIKASDGKETRFQNFTVVVKAQPRTSLLGQTWFLLVIILVLVMVCILGVFAYTHIKKKKAMAQTVIEDVFLVYVDGRLISHITRRLKPDQDGQAMTAMFTAIQEFVKDSMPTEGEARKPMEEISFGQSKILLSHGKWTYLATVVQGTETDFMKARMADALRKIEDQYAGTLEGWDGNIKELEGAQVIAKELTQ
jgi:hypothetical protein